HRRILDARCGAHPTHSLRFRKGAAARTATAAIATHVGYTSPAMTNENDEDFATLLAEFEGKENKKKRKEPRVGDEIKGRVVSIGRDSVFVDFGGKSDGLLDLAELRDADGKVTVAVGDEIEAR